MSKNIMKEVAGLLGLKLGEEFKIFNSEYTYKISEYIYKIDENKGLMSRCSDNNFWNTSIRSFENLLMGKEEIIKLPWKPKKGERYYTPSPDFGHAFCDYWDGYPSDFALKEVGMVFKSEKECETALPELRKKYLESES